MELRSTFAVTDAIREFVEHYTGALRTNGEVRVWLRDENGPRGGIDKFVAMEVHAAGRPVVRVEEHDSDVYNAIVRCAARLNLALDRQAGKRRAKRGQSTPHAAM